MTVVTLGAHILDVLARPVQGIPDGQDTVVVDQIRVTAAGAAAGTAVALARLGNEVISVGAIGDDDLGDLLVTIMRRDGVDVSGLVRRTADQTSASVLPIRPDGGRPSFHVPGANLTLTPGAVGPGLLSAADVVHLGGPDVTFGLNDPAFFDMLAAARESGTVVTMDLLSNMPDLLTGAAAFLPYVDHVLPNEEQAAALTGEDDPEKAAAALLGQGPSTVVVTLGADGSLVATAEGVHRLPVLPVEVVDTTGCGDAYCAGFITGLTHGRDVLESAHWGTAAAATVAQGLGSDAFLTDLDAVLALLS
ncbi:carbohydrate kinase family protein [Actinomadura madurae]|uniref:carbohydrate kinase family protein n=1 Tax=Actinomadura madurae TaxID=1993 RepID=UPI0020D2539D|nr:sugar kinase [Actinomadura madurae]MCP9948780.1 sugar kinase [Actinomadura madurae]MCP9965554.1 sugar kinase [Actinomadura madurae]MCP9978036.1 sugar kinase [Actinomadura madurae]MCQ0010460.1 sugar kinase [Actinomadura madurae]MCQ0014231.1 sugar kinase [Actinomadura madurae]